MVRMGSPVRFRRGAPPQTSSSGRVNDPVYSMPGELRRGRAEEDVCLCMSVAALAVSLRAPGCSNDARQQRLDLQESPLGGAWRTLFRLPRMVVTVGWSGPRVASPIATARSDWMLASANSPSSRSTRPNSSQRQATSGSAGPGAASVTATPCSAIGLAWRFKARSRRQLEARSSNQPACSPSTPGRSACPATARAWGSSRPHRSQVATSQLWSGKLARSRPTAACAQARSPSLLSRV